MQSTTSRKEFNLLIGCTGSVATIKLVPLLRALHDACPGMSTYHALWEAVSDFGVPATVDLHVKVVVTEHAKHFFDATDAVFTELNVPILTDADEYSNWSKVSDPVVHIELRKWADAMVVAPLSANTLAKVANGLCDNLLTSTLRAWDFGKPVLIAPAMNTAMWMHPVTARQLEVVQRWGYRVLSPVSKLLACGDIGVGAMAEVSSIVNEIVELIK
ncbi:hypothetical protein RI367_005211 [Sorochytrium milnesiophthora]